jgi:hypothetical protein
VASGIESSKSLASLMSQSNQNNNIADPIKRSRSQNENSMPVPNLDLSKVLPNFSLKQQ